MLALLVSCAQRPKSDLLAYRAPPAEVTIGAKSELDARIEFLEQRLEGRPKAFLDQAELAGLYLQKGKLRQRSRELELAKQWAEASMEQFPNNPARLVKADLLQMEHKFDDSLKLLGRVLVESPGDMAARALAVRVLLAQGKNQQAREVLDPVKDQPFFAFSFLQGQIFEAEGQLDEAVSMYQKSLRREREAGSASESARLRAVWARLEIQRGDLKLAKRLLASAKAIPVDLPLVEMERAKLAMASDQPQEAAKILRAAYALYQDPTFLLQLALLQKSRGQIEESAQTLKAAIASLENHPYGHEKDLAKAYLELDPQAHRNKILSLMASEFKRRRDRPTMETWTEVEKALGPLPPPTPLSQENPITQAPPLPKLKGQPIIPTARTPAPTN